MIMWYWFGVGYLFMENMVVNNNIFWKLLNNLSKMFCVEYSIDVKS